MTETAMIVGPRPTNAFWRDHIDFTGRVCRSRYFFGSWMLGLALIVPLLVGFFLASFLRNVFYGSAEMGELSATLGAIFFLVAFGLYMVALTSLYVRRLHDFNASGWWLLAYVGIVAIEITAEVSGDDGFAALMALVLFGISLFMLCKAGTPGPNRFGPEPSGWAGSRP